MHTRQAAPLGEEDIPWWRHLGAGAEFGDHQRQRQGLTQNVRSNLVAQLQPHSRDEGSQRRHTQGDLDLWKERGGDASVGGDRLPWKFGNLRNQI